MNVRQKKKREKDALKEKDLWNLNVTIARFIAPRLRAFKKINKDGIPPEFTTMKEWHGSLDKIIAAFELISLNEGCETDTDEEIQAIDEGLDLFRKYYAYLWD